MSDPTISQWVHAASAGDQDAFAEIVYTFQDAVYNLCYRMLNNRVEAEDAAQEVFLKAYGNLHRYDHNRSFKTWILSIASNHCIDQIRKRRMQYVSIDEPIPATLSLASDDPLPEQASLSRERSEAIQALLNQLEPDYRLAVVLRYWYDYSYAEIAAEMDTTESAIKSRLFRARKMLAEKAVSQADQPPRNSLTEG
ncbi:MAG: sigma-70 family RNA polymerase sigma factor [Anaerolineaceae bacterium]|nr:MAG: sigma-70 family RNA polymerase sigma factor [Anaerolineaceae bacterium]